MCVKRAGHFSVQVSWCTVDVLSDTHRANFHWCSKCFQASSTQQAFMDHVQLQEICAEDGNHRNRAVMRSKPVVSNEWRQNMLKYSGSVPAVQHDVQVEHKNLRLSTQIRFGNCDHHFPKLCWSSSATLL